MAERTFKELAEHGALAFGDGYRTKRSELDSEGVPILRVAEVKHGYLEPTLIERVSRQLEPRFGAKTSQPGDIVLTTKGTVGRVARVRPTHPRFVYSPQVCWFRSLMPEVVDPGYLYYWLRSDAFRAQADAVMGQTDMAAYINLRDLARMTVMLPPAEVQREVAAVLGALDDKLDLNSRLVADSEALLAAQFEWALAAEESAGAGASLPLGELASVLETGGRPRGGVAAYVGGIPSIGAQSIKGLALFDFSQVKYVPTEFYEAMGKGHVENRDVLLYKDGGKPGTFEPHVALWGDGFPFDRMAINEHVFRIRVLPPLTQEWLYCALTHPLAMDDMRRKGTGVAIPGLNKTAAGTVPIPVPSPEVLDAFQEVAEPLVGRALAAARESKALVDLRDALLPRLLSGELRVRDAEEQVEAVG